MRKRGRRETGPSSLVLLADHHTCQLPSSAPQVPRTSWAPLAAVMEAGDTHSEPCLNSIPSGPREVGVVHFWAGSPLQLLTRRHADVLTA
jgi:hypothetical protein